MSKRVVPTKRFYRIAACAVAIAAAAPTAHAVIFDSTSDPTFNTTAPTGDFANSGWQYQVNVGPFLGTPIAPHYYLTAAHTGAGLANNFDYNGVHYNTTQVVADFGDLRLLRVDNTFDSFAPLYDLAAGSEQSKQLVIMGRGVQRGSEIVVNGVSKGWNWGAEDGVRRWGTNNVAGFANNTTLMRFDFDHNLDVNEAILADKDSGGGVFIKVGQQWALAGINFAVTGPYSIPPDATQFVAALYDTSGMINHQNELPSTGPSGAYASLISASAANIKNLIDLSPTWKNANGGTWTASSNWAIPTGSSVPNAVGAIADFRTAIGAAQNVTFSGTITVGQIDFDNPNSYSLIPSISSSQLHLNVASGNASVNVASGNHNISALTLDDPTTFHVIQPTSTLTANISSAAGQAITKTGAGTLAVNRLVSGNLTVSQGKVRVNSAGSSGTTSNVTGVSVDTAAGAKLDLTNNDMVVKNTPVGTKVGSNYTGLSGLIAQAYAFGDWTGPGVTSSTAATSGGLTTLGIAPASAIFGLSGTDTAMWSGQIVGANDTLIGYTYAGDANLDGVIDGGDYGIIDNFAQIPGASGYFNGDFNYDGVIDGGDYGIIDNNIQAQSGSLITGAAQSLVTSGVSAVPEPSAMSLVAFASLALLKRRRRRANA